MMSNPRLWYQARLISQSEDFDHPAFAFLGYADLPSMAAKIWWPTNYKASSIIGSPGASLGSAVLLRGELNGRKGANFDLRLPIEMPIFRFRLLMAQSMTPRRHSGCHC